MMTLNINLLASVKMDKDLCNTETSTYFGNVINKDGRTDIQYMTTQNLPALHGINITVWGGELKSDGTRPIQTVHTTCLTKNLGLFWLQSVSIQVLLVQCPPPFKENAK